MAAGTGFVVGLDAGFPITEGFRWLTSGFYARCPMELSDGVTSLHASGEPTPTTLFSVLTGLEYRSEGSASVKFHLIGQVGGLWAQMADPESSRVRSLFPVRPTTSRYCDGSSEQLLEATSQLWGIPRFFPPLVASLKFLFERPLA